MLVTLLCETPACTYCGLRNDRCGLGFQIDHTHPLSRGGRHEMDNLALACAQCNRAKWNLTRDEFERWLARAAQHLAAPNPMFYNSTYET
ncbi:HNH endonuclease [Deinococcus multiflagellatus]|uniref:HNH endonuclease n=1 Tax=Deinococcus multiflagellatus TaxID=1656887 RepID=A0ABW1ZHM2_9DEIO|nr:HNH endonuclease [Deinococcus multiflagellatus]